MREPSFQSAVHVLPELRSVRYDDVDQWIREYVTDVDKEALRRRIAARFLTFFGLRRRIEQQQKERARAKGSPATRV